jgi:dolichyl-phosphate-mannose--protein O-mannosyl transferase
VTPRRAAWLTIFACVVVYAVRLGTPAWRDVPPRYAFDESYTAFTAHRLLQGDATVFAPAARRYAYLRGGVDDLATTSRGEWNHPPGGPLAIAATMSILGFSAVGARVASLLAAVAALIAIAYLAGPRRAWLACALVGCDGAFFVFARTAMPQMFVVAGVTVGAALTVHALAVPHRRWPAAIAAGAAFGFAIAVRWTAIPIALAVAIGAIASSEGRRARLRGPLLAALVTALVVYLASFAPYLAHGHGLAELVRMHRTMFAFHTGLPAHAAQSAAVASWPWTLRPVTFLVETTPTEVAAVLCTGGRLLWWSLVPLLLIGAWRARRRGARWLVPVLAIAATWLPWFAIDRFGMTYDLLPALPFVAVLAARIATRLRVRALCVVLAILTFAVMYPVLAAVPISRATYDAYRSVLG